MYGFERWQNRLDHNRQQQPCNVIHLGSVRGGRDASTMMLRPTVIAAVLFAAALHAGWNVVVRAGTDRRRETSLVVTGGAVLAGVMLPFLPVPPVATWRYLLTSAGLNAVYFVLIAEAYARGGIALAYPLMRGVAPMLAALAAWGLIGEALPMGAWIGIATICAGVVALSRPRSVPGERVAVRLALANAVVIAAYTLNDAVGVRLSGAPFAYALWLFPLTALPTLLWLHRHAAPRRPTLREGLRGLGGAGCAIGSYGLVLWAMTRAPVAPVAALRETAILFGVLLARLLLGERPSRWGWGGALAIAAGAAILRLG
jgi:drug/metabolite transporter (DMT)-like permease